MQNEIVRIGALSRPRSICIDSRRPIPAHSAFLLFPMPAVATELIILAAMLLVNGFFALAEIAVVSARKARLRHLADRGSKRAAAALAAATQPARFLSTVQAGVTLVCSTDAHSVRGLGNMALSVATARRGWATPSNVLNTLPLREVLER